MLVHRYKLSPHAMVLEQPRRHARVLRGDRVGPGERFEGARADVLEVPNGRGDHI